MIISPTNRLIFLHSRKAAGSSICVSLARYLGSEDLQFSAIVETVQAGIPLSDRVKQDAYHSGGWGIKLSQLAGHRAYGRSLSRSLQKSYQPALGRKPSHAHAARVAAAFPDAWKTCKKLCVVRNPWSKTLSDYYWRTKAVANPPDFTTYVRALAGGDDLNGIVPVEFHDNWPIYTIDDCVVADHVVRFETLKPGLQYVFDAVGLDWDGWLPRAKSGLNAAENTGHTAQRSYRTYYTDETAEIVERLYSKEIEAFDYAF